MGDQSMTILRCLQEVDNSRPYFVGFIAQRYGWHQEIKGGDINLQKTFDLAAQHPEYPYYVIIASKISLIM